MFRPHDDNKLSCNKLSYITMTSIVFKAHEIKLPGPSHSKSTRGKLCQRIKAEKRNCKWKKTCITTLQKIVCSAKILRQVQESTKFETSLRFYTWWSRGQKFTLTQGRGNKFVVFERIPAAPDIPESRISLKKIRKWAFGQATGSWPISRSPFLEGCRHWNPQTTRVSPILFTCLLLTLKVNGWVNGCEELLTSW